MTKKRSADSSRLEIDGRNRVVIEHVRPEVDGGRFPIKRAAGEAVTIEADAFVDGHDKLVCLLLHRRESEGGWTEVPMTAVGNDRWHGLSKRPDSDPN